jgi:hypothetical protein
MGGYAPAVRARGRGGAGAGADAAPEIEGVDLRIAFKVCVEDHVMYARVHDDLVVVKRLTLAEALTGCTMLLPHPSRRQLRVSTPVGLVVTPGQRFTVEGGEWVGVVCVAWAWVYSGRSATEPAGVMCGRVPQEPVACKWGMVVDATGCGSAARGAALLRCTRVCGTASLKPKHPPAVAPTLPSTPSRLLARPARAPPALPPHRHSPPPLPPPPAELPCRAPHPLQRRQLPHRQAARRFRPPHQRAPLQRVEPVRPRPPQPARGCGLGAGAGVGLARTCACACVRGVAQAACRCMRPRPC